MVVNSSEVSVEATAFDQSNVIESLAESRKGGGFEIHNYVPAAIRGVDRANLWKPWTCANDFGGSLALDCNAHNGSYAAFFFFQAVRMVNPRITRLSSNRAIRFCAVPREIFSFFARLAAGSRALARSSASSLRSVSSIISAPSPDETTEYWRILSV